MGVAGRAGEAAEHVGQEQMQSFQDVLLQARGEHLPLVVFTSLFSLPMVLALQDESEEWIQKWDIG